MTLLCVDIGNTSIKMARVQNRVVSGVQVVPSDASRTTVLKAIARASRAGVDGAAITSVRPRSTDVVRRALVTHLGGEPLVVSHRCVLPIRIATRRPVRVGVDRICAAVGAVPGRKGAAIVVDAGSAITVDRVVRREFQGGLIMPGPAMMLSALHRFTASLPEVKIDGSGLGRIDDTVPAMLTGTVVGSAGAITAAVRLLRSAVHGAIPVWLTGGHAPRLRSRLPASWRFEPHLTLLGLYEIARLPENGLVRSRR